MSTPTNHMRFDAIGASMLADAVKSGISAKKKVGAVVMAWDGTQKSFRFFSGSNLWFSESFAAETR